MSLPTHVDCIIDSRWILPVVPRDTLLEHCSVVINQGLIIDIVPSAGVTTQYKSDQHLSLDKHLLMPGLINGHGHAAMSLLRGYADDLPLMTWLEKHIWPAEAEWVDDEFVYQGTQLAIAEMLLAGTTYFSDMYFFPEQAAQAASEIGIKAQITFPILDFPTNWARDADQYIQKGLQLHDRYRNSRLIRVGFGPHAPYTVSDEPLREIATLASQLDAPIQIHLHETAGEVEQSLHKLGVRPIERLNRLGILGPQTQCVHMTQINDQDRVTIRETQATVIHCPESNLKLASGMCPVANFLADGVAIGLGTDGAASNNDLNLLGELQSAALIAKLAQNDASAVSAMEAIELATLGGARALGIADQTGSLEKGKAADLIALKLDHPSLSPNYNLLGQIAYNNRGMNVTHVWVAGHMLVHQGQLLTLDLDRVLQQSRAWQEKIQPERSART